MEGRLGPVVLAALKIEAFASQHNLEPHIECFRIAASDLVHIPATARDIVYKGPDIPEPLDTPRRYPWAKLLSMELPGCRQA